MREVAELWSNTAHTKPRGEEAEAKRDVPGHRARHRAAERTHRWMNRFRRLLVRWEKKARTCLGFFRLACAWITCRAAGLLG